MYIQCTKKLLDQLDLTPEPARESDPLFSWHTNLVMVGRRKTVILVNDKNRYVIVLHGLKAKDFSMLDDLIFQAIREAFTAEGIKAEVVEQYLDLANKIVYTKTKDKASVAKMNQASKLLPFFEEFLTGDHLIKSHLSKKMSSLLVGDGNRDYFNPNEKMYKDLEVFAGQPIFNSKAVELKVTLNLEKHKIWRSLVVPVHFSFDIVHQVLQAAFGWNHSHLHEFYIYDHQSSKPIVHLICDQETRGKDVPVLLESEALLKDYVSKQMTYIYDFGDHWEHAIEVDKTINDYDKPYATCLEGHGDAPPDDVGGELGYELFLDMIGDKAHLNHQDMVNWAQGQNFQEFSIDKVNRLLKSIR